MAVVVHREVVCVTISVDTVEAVTTGGTEVVVAVQPWQGTVMSVVTVETKVSVVVEPPVT